VPYLVIALIALATAAISALMVRSGLKWARSLRIPDWSPSPRSLLASWAVLLALAALSAVFAWNAMQPHEHPRLIAVYVINAFLNAAWCYLFFVRHQMGSATLEAALLAIAVAVIVLDVIEASVIAAILVLPLFVWALFGMYLTLTIFRMNVSGRGGGDV